MGGSRVLSPTSNGSRYLAAVLTVGSGFCVDTTQLQITKCVSHQFPDMRLKLLQQNPVEPLESLRERRCPVHHRRRPEHLCAD